MSDKIDYINSTIESVNNSVPIAMPIFESLRAVVDLLMWLVGGLFGIYLIFMIFKWYESRKIRNIMDEMLAKLSSLDERVRNIEKKIDTKNKRNKK